MQDMLYNMIFKRKSFHIFKDIGTISAAELCEIEEKYRSFFAACGRHKKKQLSELFLLKSNNMQTRSGILYSFI